MCYASKLSAIYRYRVGHLHSVGDAMSEWAAFVNSGYSRFQILNVEEHLLAIMEKRYGKKQKQNRSKTSIIT